MKILIVSATLFEIQPLIDWLKADYDSETALVFTKGELSIEVLITGVGMMHTAFALGNFLTAKPYIDLAINAGIAGAFNRKLKLGEVVNVISDQFGDLGVEEADGQFTGIHQMGLIEPDSFPFKDGLITNPNVEKTPFLPGVQGLTVNKVHGNSINIGKIKAQYPDADIETMEGVAFFYACMQMKVAALQIRAISNYVESRNKNKWKIGMAIDHLNMVLKEMIQSFV